MSVDPFLAILVHGVLGLLLLASAQHKLRDAAGFAQAVEDYRLLPAALVTPAAALLALAEIVAGLAALWPWGLVGRAGLAGAAALLTLYAGAIAINLLRGRRSIDCGCLAFGKTGQPIHPLMVVRNLLLAAIAIVVATADLSARPLLWLDWFGLAFAVAATALLYSIMEAALPRQAREIRL